MAALQREGTAVSHCKHPAICACRQHQRSLRWKPLKATWLLNAYPAAAAVACRRQRSPVTSAEQLQHACFAGGIIMQRNYQQAPHVSLHESLMYPARRSQHHLSFNHFVVTLHSQFRSRAVVYGEAAVRLTSAAHAALFIAIAYLLAHTILTVLDLSTVGC